MVTVPQDDASRAKGEPVGKSDVERRDAMDQPTPETTQPNAAPEE